MTIPAEEVTAVEVIPGLTILDLTDLPEPGGSGEADAKPAGRHHREPKPESGSDGKPPPTGAPSASEWQDFIGGTVLRLLSEGYLNLVLFRQVDESELTERERKLITLEKGELRDMATPMASFAAKNKHARKHGREIIAAADSYEALVDLFIWMRRVNKIARKHRKTNPEAVIIQGKVETDGKVPGQDSRQPGPAVNGYIPRSAG